MGRSCMCIQKKEEQLRLGLPDPREKCEAVHRHFGHMRILTTHTLIVSRSLFISRLCMQIRSYHDNHRHHCRCRRRSPPNRRRTDSCNNGASRSRVATASVMCTDSPLHTLFVSRSLFISSLCLSILTCRYHRRNAVAAVTTVVAVVAA